MLLKKTIKCLSLTFDPTPRKYDTKNIILIIITTFKLRFSGKLLKNMVRKDIRVHKHSKRKYKQKNS
jgi:hypothetical protein